MMKMFARVSLLTSLGLAGTIGCSASVGTLNGSGGSGSNAGGSGPGVGGANGAGGGLTGNGGSTFGNGGSTFGNGGSTFGNGGSTFGNGGSGVGGTDAGAGGAAQGAGGAADTGPGCTATAFTVSNESYIDNGTFCGYAWTAAYADGGTIEPPCPEAGGNCFMGDICATAVIPANDDDAGTYPGVMIGWNIAQKSSGGTAASFTGTFSSITPTFTTTGVTGEVRLVVQSGNTDYCATATSGKAISAGTFAKTCWDDAAAVPLPAGTPIKTILLQVNGASAAQPAVEFCLTGLTVQ